MALRVDPASDEDLKRLIPVIFDAYGGHNPYLNAAFPRNLTKEGQEKALQRVLDMQVSNETSQWEKVTDTATGEIIGGAMWLIYQKEKSEIHELDGPSGTWENETEKEYAQALYNSYVREERAFWESNHLAPVSKLSLPSGK
ncbi:hypothetical protein K469DRAFT_587722 [Zopfia rhizophila CBS 207.26]|uniref:N-acetyltransferase domain-containing protein n=1 Tax=Zopfia rhizophila CBS 207.26 TaxID=1314779 RepID=A0A6A6DV08_9PEZI|nr:hypothetical protein K469DRAFT_587722 [Zopfia rhizophila CBS 207.26]